MGNISPLLLTYKVNNMLSFIDPFTLNSILNNIISPQAYDLGANYWHNPFTSVLNRNDLIEFYVIDIDLLGPRNGKFALAEATVIRSSDFGVREKYFYTRTHLGFF